MQVALAAGVAYFAVVFAAGFVLGTARVLLLVPAIGATGAVLAEMPPMLAIAWVAAGRLIARFGVPGRVAARLAMGATGVGLLVLTEAGLGRALGTGWQPLADVAGLVGLAGQAAFGLMPLAVRRDAPPLP